MKRKELFMTSEGLALCSHCGNFMVRDRFFTDQGSYEGFRCPLCGEVVDLVILENRKNSFNPFIKIKKYFKPVKYA